MSTQVRDWRTAFSSTPSFVLNRCQNDFSYKSINVHPFHYNYYTCVGEDTKCDLKENWDYWVVITRPGKGFV